MTPWLQDADVTLYHGDALAVLRELPAESVDCCVTSPPYWGLRDYGQEGQLGLEPTPEAYGIRMVEVFREVRRVLATHGTVWLNLGDSYVSTPSGSLEGSTLGSSTGQTSHSRQAQVRDGKAVHGDVLRPYAVAGLQPKNLVGIPWRIAFALQADGWYLRSDIIWAKPNPMPESVTDRPTKMHEYVFLLSKQPRYFFDQEAVREPAAWARWGDQTNDKHEGSESAASWIGSRPKSELTPARRKPLIPEQTLQGVGTQGIGSETFGHWAGERGRNIRSVWEIPTQPYPMAHFATFPEELARRCIAAGCPEDGVVLDPFIGSGTVAHVARKLGRHAIGIDLNESYLELAARRLQQQSLFAEGRGVNRMQENVQ